ncbi:MAG: hypothetical protein HQ536_01600 [Parcubacteria group bacterium]|nr:hypothetical protein [Parcubacteria group bacterium]
MKKQTGFLRLTLVLSVISAITGFLWCFLSDIWCFLSGEIEIGLAAFVAWFVATWVAYVIARWIIPTLIKWIIKGFGEDGIRKIFITINIERLRMFVYVCVGILSIILSIYFSFSLITKIAEIANPKKSSYFR